MSQIVPGGRVRRLIRAGVAAAGLATTLMSASPASADPHAFADAGVYLGYTWGRGGGFTWGIEGRAGVASDEWNACAGDAVGIAATAVRLSFVDLDRMRLGMAMQGGIGWGPLSALLDLGVGYRWGEDGGLSVPFGMDLQVFMASTFITYDSTLHNGFAGGGARWPSPDRQLGCVSVGRALHDEAGHAELPKIRALGEREHCPGLGDELGGAIAGEWGRRAQGEWASVPAFLQLADQLARAGAPRSLVDRALRSADDELRHAASSARVAVEHGGVPLGLGRVTPATRAPAEGSEALRRLAVESWVDGCLGEGRAAAAAAREAERARVDRVRDVQRGIAADEARHAELAWDVLAWTLREGGDDVRHAVWASRDAVPGGGSGGPDGIALDAYGVLSERAHERVEDETRAQALGRLGRVLA